MKIKVLNLYAGIGGNRKLWPNDMIEVTAVEIDPKIAAIYQKFFPNDKVAIGDAHQYLLDHYQEFDFIWSSPPCPSHSRARYWGWKSDTTKSQYPDMSLYQEIVFLQNYSESKWVVENVISYYKPLIKPFLSGNHYFWSNFVISDMKQKPKIMDGFTKLEESRGFKKDDFEDFDDKRKLLRNCTEPDLGLHVFNCAFKVKQMVLCGIENVDKEKEGM